MKSVVRLAASVAIFLSALTFALGTAAFFADGSANMGMNVGIVGAALALFLFAGSAWVLVDISEALAEPTKRETRPVETSEAR